jgi:hypothetical protein
MMESGLTMLSKVKQPVYGKMVQSMWEAMQIISLMAKEPIQQKLKNIKEVFTRVTFMARVCLSTKERPTRGSSRMG